jgi:diguanylate cyclase (GGDEF)-like protein
MKNTQDRIVLQKIACKDCLLEDRVKKLETAYLELRYKKVELRLENRRLKRELETDELTGLKKTIHFEKLCFSAMHKHLKRREMPLPTTMKERRQAEGYFLALVDLDGLKMANDTPSALGGGHEAGDALLRALAKTLLKRTRNTYDRVVRFGKEADEFGVFMTGLTKKEARHRMETIKKHFEETARERCPTLWDHFLSLGLKISFSFDIGEIFPDYSEEDIRNVMRTTDDGVTRHKERRKQDRKTMQQVCSDVWVQEPRGSII